MNYREKLRDPRWQKVRLKIFKRDNWTCRACLESTRTLAVHHIRYTADDPWNESWENLSTVCEDCHAAIREYGKLKESLKLDDSDIIMKRAMAMLAHYIEVMQGSGGYNERVPVKLLALVPEWPFDSQMEWIGEQPLGPPQPVERTVLEWPSGFFNGNQSGLGRDGIHLPKVTMTERSTKLSEMLANWNDER